MKISRRISRLRSIAALTSLVLAMAAPPLAQAHGELEIRIADFTQKIKASTNNPAQLYLERGEAHREHLDWIAAEADYARAEQLDPKLPKVDLYRARMLDDSGQLELARALFGKILARNPKEGEAFIGRARVLVKLGNRKPAIKDFQSGLKLLSKDAQPEYYLELAQTFKALGNTSDALRTLDQGMELFGNLLTLQSYALELELNRGKNDAALTRLDAIIKDAPRKETWLVQRGDILLSTGQWDEAQKSYQAALVAVKSLPKILQNAPPLQKLQSQIHLALAKITTASTAKTEPILNGKNEN